MVQVFLIVAPVIVAVLLVIVDIYLIAYYQHPLDKNTAYIPKIVAVRREQKDKNEKL